MATFNKLKLSGSTDGKAIKIAATATPGTTLHTAHATALDEVWLYLINTGLVGIEVTIEWGGTTDPDDTIVQTVAPREGLVLVVPGLLLTNSQVIKAFATNADTVLALGFVNRIA